MRVSREGIREIKQRNDIAEVVSEHGVKLKLRGTVYYGLCPFHKDTRPSFTLKREIGYFHCFGCGTGGDVITFLVQYHQVTFTEALRRLAVRAGLQLEAFMVVRWPDGFTGRQPRNHGLPAPDPALLRLGRGVRR
jgi:DNA primase